MQNALQGASRPTFVTVWDVLDEAQQRPVQAAQAAAAPPAEQARSGSGARYKRAAFFTTGSALMAGGIALTTLGFMGCDGKGPFSLNGKKICQNLPSDYWKDWNPNYLGPTVKYKGLQEPTSLQIGTMIGGPIMAALGLILLGVGCCVRRRNAAPAPIERNPDIELPAFNLRPRWVCARGGRCCRHGPS